MDYYKCRLCLEETNRCVEIFNESFPEMIRMLTDIKVEPEDGLPTTSCLQCHQEVKSAMLTRYQIINSHKILLDELKCNIDTYVKRVANDQNKVNNEFIDIDNQKISPKQEVDLKQVKKADDCYSLLDNFSDEHKKSDLIIKFNVEKCVEKTFNSNNIKDKKKVSNNFCDIDNQGIGSKEDTNLTTHMVADDCDDLFDDFSCDENERSEHILSSSGTNSIGKGVKIDVTHPLEKEKLGDKVSKKKKIRKSLNKEIKFRKKRTKRPKLVEDRIEFKKKTSTDNGFSVKVQYDIKPEHQEFLKSVGRKDRVGCPDCGRVMFGMNMKNHLITHNYDPVICDICGKTSKNAQALQDHINYYHKTTPDRFMCDKCGKGYRVRFMLERHEKKEHGTGEKDYECSICGKKFFEKLHLKNHINITHKKIKAYKCEHCGKDFGRRTQFVTHQLVHTKENRYHCQVCGKGFKIKQTMQTHLKGVHGIEEEKTIFCKICQKGFSTPQGLRAHVNSRVHGLEKCEHCSEFITVEYKSVHLRDIHGIKTETPYS